MVLVLDPAQLQVLLHVDFPDIASHIASEITNPSHTFNHVSPIETRLKTSAISRQDYLAYLATSLESSSLQIAPNEYRFSSYTYLADMIDVEEPKHFRYASSNPLWQQAMQEEFDALKSRGLGYWFMFLLKD